MNEKQTTTTEVRGKKMSEVKIDTSELDRLREAAETLQALEDGGVDNWDGYDDSLSVLRKERDLKGRIEEATSNLLYVLSGHIYAPAGHEASYSICGDEPYEIVLKFIKEVKEIENA